MVRCGRHLKIMIHPVNMSVIKKSPEPAQAAAAPLAAPSAPLSSPWSGCSLEM
jgi:hypothetical protein